MSFLASLESFFDKVGAELKKLFGSTTWEQQARAVITYVAPILEIILAFADPPIEPLVAGVINTVQADLATVSAVVSSATVTAGETTAQVVQTALGSIKANLAGLLTMAAVKNSAKVQQITAAVGSITTEVDALLQNIPGAAPAATPAA